MKIVKDFSGLYGKTLSHVYHTPDGLLIIFDDEVALMLSATEDEHGREPYVIYVQDEKLIADYIHDYVS